MNRTNNAIDRGVRTKSLMLVLLMIIWTPVRSAEPPSAAPADPTAPKPFVPAITYEPSEAVTCSNIYDDASCIYKVSVHNTSPQKITCKVKVTLTPARKSKNEDPTDVEVSGAATIAAGATSVVLSRPGTRGSADVQCAY